MAAEPFSAGLTTGLDGSSGQPSAVRIDASSDLGDGHGVQTAGKGAAGDTSMVGAAGATAADGSTGTGAAGADAGTGAAGDAASIGAGTSGAAGMGAAGASSAGTSGTLPPIALPFTVSDHFKPTGAMGDGAVAGAVTIATAVDACAGEPAAAKAGTCYSVTYQPQPIQAGAPRTWAGFFWQYPDNNWGSMQPQFVADGANAISFYARGVSGGERITFKAGGIVNTPSVATPFSDAFTIQSTITLTTKWTKYVLSMTGLTYGGGVLGAFCWVAEAANADPIKFLLHGIVWEK